MSEFCFRIEIFAVSWIHDKIPITHTETDVMLAFSRLQTFSVHMRKIVFRSSDFQQS